MGNSAILSEGCRNDKFYSRPKFPHQSGGERGTVELKFRTSAECGETKTSLALEVGAWIPRIWGVGPNWSRMELTALFDETKSRLFGAVASLKQQQGGSLVSMISS